MFKYVKFRLQYSVNARLANISSTLFIAAPNETIGDMFYALHKHFTVKAHTARMKAQKELEPKYENY